MGQHVAHVDLAAVEVNQCDQPVLVAADVEHSPIADLIGRRKGSTQLIKRVKVSPLHDLEPACQRRFAVGMPCPEVAQGFSRDHVHEQIVSQIAIAGKSSTALINDELTPKIRCYLEENEPIAVSTLGSPMNTAGHLSI